jgi:hypothetical protein
MRTMLITTTLNYWGGSDRVGWRRFADRALFLCWMPVQSADPAE